MEVHVDRDAFMRGLQMAHNVVEPRQTLPVLANVLLDAQGDTLRLTATDLEVSVRVTASAPTRTVAAPPFAPGSMVRLKTSGELASIAEVHWHWNKDRPYFLVDREGRRSSRRYWTEDLTAA